MSRVALQDWLLLTARGGEAAAAELASPGLSSPGILGGEDRPIPFPEGTGHANPSFPSSQPTIQHYVVGARAVARVVGTLPPSLNVSFLSRICLHGMAAFPN